MGSGKAHQKRAAVLAMLVLAIGLLVPTASAGNSKVDVCHKGKKTLHIDEAAVEAHLDHGDWLGKCGADQGEEPDDGGDTPPGDGGDGGNEEPGTDPPTPNDEGAGSAQLSRAGYCLNGSFYDLVVGQPLTDPKYAGATEAKVGLPGNPNAVHCDSPSEAPPSETTDAVQGASVPDSLRWCGETFTTRKEFRTHFGLTRAEMKAFLASHPAAAAILS